MKEVFLSQLQPTLQQKFIDYFIRYDIQFQYDDSGNYYTVLSQSTLSGKEQPKKSTVMKVVATGKLFTLLNFNKYDKIIQFAKNYAFETNTKIRNSSFANNLTKTISYIDNSYINIDDMIPISSSEDLFQQIQKLVEYQLAHPKKTSFQLIFETFPQPQQLINFLYNIQIATKSYIFARTISSFAESDLSIEITAPFFMTVNFFLQQESLNNLLTFSQLKLQQRTIRDMTLTFFQQYYEESILEELQGKQITGDLAIHVYYQQVMRYGAKCVRDEILEQFGTALLKKSKSKVEKDLARSSYNSQLALSKSQTLQDELLQSTSKSIQNLKQLAFDNSEIVEQKVFIQAQQSVLEQYYNCIIQHFKLNQIHQSKLQKEIQNIFSIYIQLLTNFSQYEKYKNTVFLKKYDVTKLQAQLSSLRTELIECKTYKQCFSFFKRMLQNETVKKYLDAFITSMIFIQNQDQ